MLPFILGYNPLLGLLIQVAQPEISAILERAYASGSLLGTAMDDTRLGRAYADDFLAFLLSLRPLRGLRILEIGAGRGYLLKRLSEQGANALGIEPGCQNAPYWDKFSVRVIAGSFPSPMIQDSFDLIVSYAVLEHIVDSIKFLAKVREHLSPGGLVAFAVPDDAQYIAAGDPSMLLHEHYSYFTPNSLSRLLQWSGYRVISLSKAGYGGAIYCAAAREDDQFTKTNVGQQEILEAQDFARKCERNQNKMAAELSRLARKNRSVGIYCPARALALLPENSRLRFFDDDPEIAGHYYPPFSSPVETRQNLLQNPVDDLLITSRTFGYKLKTDLASERQLKHCTIKTIDELLPS